MKFVFLDRDGVLNRFPGREKYVVAPEEFQIFSYAPAAVALLCASGFEVNVVSNQGCISRGLLSPQDLESMTDRLVRTVAAAGGKFGGVYYCPHQTSDGCECRKPKTQLLQNALKGRPLGTRETMYIVGDSEVDIAAGLSFGCTTILVLSGGSALADVDRFSAKPDYVMKDLMEASQWIAQRKS